jgi:hypothetical protein
MTLPTTFAALTDATGAELDANFAALGACTTIPCSVSGTNVLVLTPLTNTPAVPAYADYMQFSFTAVGTNTTGVMAQVGSLPALDVARDTPAGRMALIGNEIVAGDFCILAFDTAVDSGAGGFHLLSTRQVPQYQQGVAATVNSSTAVTLTAAALTGNGTGVGIVLRTGSASGGVSDVTDTAANILAALPGAVVSSTFRTRFINTTGQTVTLTAGSGVTVNATANTTANNASHEFLGVVTAIGTPAVEFYG